MKRTLSLSALLLWPLQAFAVSIEDYGFDCESAYFVGCDWVGSGTDAIIQFMTGVNFRVFSIIWGVAVIAVAYGAIRIISSRGQSDGIEQGKKAIMWAVLGAILMSLALPFINFITAFLYNVG